MTAITALATGQRHRVGQFRAADPRIVWTRCGERMTFGERPACRIPECPNHPPAPKTTDCAECRP